MFIITKTQDKVSDLLLYLEEPLWEMVSDCISNPYSEQINSCGETLNQEDKMPLSLVESQSPSSVVGTEELATHG